MDGQKYNQLKKDVRDALFNSKVIAFPIACRVAWHASGTYDASDGTGGSDGGTMRFEPEKSDPANAGLGIIRGMLHEVHKKYPEVSQADLWTLAGALSIEFSGGPHIPFVFGRTDDTDGSKCPAHGRLPDASQGAAHLRAVFHRMGLADRDIVALSGGHTLGRCHLVRSGFDGKWTRNPLKFDNEYFRNLINLSWKKRDWDGNVQYTDVETEELMMLPTDIALKTDPAFREYTELYARDQQAFFRDFAESYSRLLSLGTKCCPHLAALKASDAAAKTAEFREACMHGVKEIAPIAAEADVHAPEPGTGRTGLHKAAYWGHDHTVDFLVRHAKVNVNHQDSQGDTALHDAARFGHLKCVQIMLEGSPKLEIRNKKGQDVLAVATEYENPEVVAMLRAAKSKL